MTSKKKGILTTSGEWAKHLRPRMKRIFWSGERNEEIKEMESEKQNVFIPTVEEILAEIQSWNPTKTEQNIYVAKSLTHKNISVANGIAMSIVLDRVLSLGYFPKGKTVQEHGVVYHYHKEDIG